MTHGKLPKNAIRIPLIHRLLTLQLGQEVPQYPGLLLHGWLYSLPATGHLSQACQDTQVLVLAHGVCDRRLGFGFGAVALLLLPHTALLYCVCHIKELPVRELCKLS